MWLLFVTTEYGQDCKLWKERKKRLRAWHTFAEAKKRLTEIPEDLQRPELLEMLQKADKVIRDMALGIVPQGGDGDTGKESEDE